MYMKDTDRHKAFFLLDCFRHLAAVLSTTAAFRHRMMNTITKIDDYIIILIKITPDGLMTSHLIILPFAP